MKLIIFIIVIITTCLFNIINGQWISNTLYNLNDDSCVGSKLVTNYYRENVCDQDNGVISICSNGAVEINVYEFKNCTGGIKRQESDQIGKCLSGAYQMNCTDSYELPNNSYIAIKSSTCDDYKDNIVSVVATFTNACQLVDSNSINYKCTSDSAFGYFYYSDNCSGKSAETQKMPFSSTCNDNTNTTYICNN